MNADELRELAKTFIGIADGKPWECEIDEGWRDSNQGICPLSYVRHQVAIRLKPWELGRTINGHTLPDGAEWHRQDFADGMMPPPYRPLMDGEAPQYGDQFAWYSDDWTDCSGPSTSVDQANSKYRTTRPIPFTLTPEQIADGWVLWSGGECPVEPESRPTVMYRMCLTIDEVTTGSGNLKWYHSNGGGDIIAYRPDPYGKFRQALADGKTVQCILYGEWGDLDAPPEWILPPNRYRIKPEPRWIPLGPEDVPPGSVFRNPTWLKWSYRTPTQVSPAGVYFFMNEGPTEWAVIEKHWQINRPSHRDADGNPTLWESCRKEAK